MHVIIAYDIVSNSCRNKMFKLLKEIGVNSQLSVFECELNKDEISSFVERAKNIIDLENDSLIIYALCDRCASKVKVIGSGITLVNTVWEIL